MRFELIFFAAGLAASTIAQTGFIPLDDLGTGTYQGRQGGLYPGGSNVRPQGHELGGLFQASFVIPRDGEGNASSTGKIGLLTIGMSNTRFESIAWGSMIATDSQVNPLLVFVNGAQSGQTAEIIADENGQGRQFWANVDQYLTTAGLTRKQVQVIWLKEADANPTQGWPTYAIKLKDELIQICGILRKRFPNARLCYNASRIYGGYANTTLNPEPYAYESGFSVKGLIEEQLRGNLLLAYGGRQPSATTPRSPWLSWGPYTWADGTNPRSDGLVWLRQDFRSDGTHPSDLGSAKVAQMLMDFFKTDTTTRSWFVRQ